MLQGWRERDQQKRIETAHEALEQNSRYSRQDSLIFGGKLKI